RVFLIDLFDLIEERRERLRDRRVLLKWQSRPGDRGGQRAPIRKLLPRVTRMRLQHVIAQRDALSVHHIVDVVVALEQFDLADLLDGALQPYISSPAAGRDHAHEAEGQLTLM